jgi:RNA polymerase sigma factor (sigma-70 family)
VSEKIPKAVARLRHPQVAWKDSAFKEVYSRYVKPVHAYVFHRVRNHHDAEDLTAQVFSQALKHMDPREPGEPEIAAWLFTSARNASANHARTRRFVATISIEEVGEPASDDVERSDLSQALVDEEQIAQLLSAVRKLPAEQRRAMILRFVDELPHAEIAQALGRTEGSARVLVHRTIATLKKEVS